MMDIFDLSAKLRLDSSEYEKGLSGAAEKARSIGSGIGNALGVAAKATVAGITAAGTAVGALTKQSVDAYSEYQQLVGGVETLFSTVDGSASAASEVMENANKAFRTAGMSANQYMETVTSFSASLIQSTGRGAQTDLDQLEQTLDDEYKATKRSLEDQYKEAQRYWSDRLALAKDTSEKDAIKAQRDAMLADLKRSNEDQLEALKQHNKEALEEAERANNESTTSAESLARAAELADKAVIDMSDNANKMGTNIQSIQNAYQGFAKQNFTMLDNLKLGYGGTKEEMERLLQDAEQLKAKQGEVADYSVSSYADIVEAIHVVQESMGISGTTASEAAGTITGSLGMVKAAWENLVTGFANDQADMGSLIEDLVNSAEGAFNNLLPIVEQALQGIGTFIDKIVPIIGEKLPQLVETLLPMLVNTATNLFNSLAQALPTILETLMAVIPTVMDTVMNTITTLLPQLVAVGQQALLTITDGILQNISALTDTAVEIILVLMEGMTAALPELLPATVEAILTVVEGLLDNTDKLIDASVELITALAEGLIKSLDILLQRAPIIVEKLTRAIMQNAPKLLQAAVEIITKLALYIIQNLPKIVGVATQVIVSFIGGLSSLYQQVNQAGMQIIMNVWNGIKSLNPFQWGADLIREFISGITSGFRGLGSAVSGVAGTVRSYLHFSEPDEGPLADFHTYAPDMMKLFAQGIADNGHLISDQLNKTLDFGLSVKAPALSGAPMTGGAVTINVYGAKGQDEERLAQIVMNKLNYQYGRQKRAYAGA